MKCELAHYHFHIEWFILSSLRRNGCHFSDDIFNSIFMNEKFCNPIPISLKFVSEGPIDNKYALVQVMAWH